MRFKCHKLDIFATITILMCAFAFSPPASAEPPAPVDGEWPCYGRDPGGNRFAPLTEIDRQNVGRLQVAWTYRTGDLSDGKDGPVSAFEATPLMVDGTLFVVTPFNRVIALDAASGKERWTFDPKIPRRYPEATDVFVCRGVSTWVDPKKRPGDFARRRIFLGTHDGRLIALDAASGKPCPDFGTGGEINLKQGIGNTTGGVYQITTPPAILRDRVIIGSCISDNQRADMPSGVVRAFDARSGKLIWKFEPVPRNPADPARKTWEGDSADTTGAANTWSMISVDAARDLVFLPTGSASPDFYGGKRLGDNRYANCLVALRGSTGKVVWHFQVVHHDLWDYDIPAQPNLITVRRNGKDIPAVAVGTKMGLLFLLDRETGKPLFPVEERPVPQEAIAGERPSPTQPFPTLPLPLVPHGLSPDDAWGLTPEMKEAARQRIAGLKYGSIYTPPSLQGTVLYPGNIGGMNWSGMSFDPLHGLLIANVNRLATVITLIDRERLKNRENLTDREKNLIDHGPAADTEYAPQRGTPYVMLREWLLNREPRLPQTRPPWGTLVAVDVNTGAVRWNVPLGTLPHTENIPGAASWGSPNIGGSIVTAGGLVFIAATMDDAFRAFDVETGKELWKTKLPAGGQATPMTYRMPNGKQYVVLCAGGSGRLGTTQGDYVIAYTLP